MARNRSEFITEGGILEVDAAIKTNFTSKNTLTKYPIEGGGQITEHMSSENSVFTIQGLISDASPGDITEISVVVDRIFSAVPTFLAGQIASPVVNLARFSPLANQSTKAADARVLLQGLRDNKEVFSYRTPTQLYENMTMTSISFGRSVKSGNALPFSATLEQAQFAFSKVQQQEVLSNTVVRSAGDTNDIGNNSGQDVTEAINNDPDQTVLLKFRDLFPSVLPGATP